MHDGADLSSEHTAREGAPNSGANVVFFVQRSVLLLGALTVQHMVLALLCDRRDETVLVSDV
jgi:hypothetical protein